MGTVDRDTRDHDFLIAELNRQELRLLRSLARDRWAPLLATTLTIQQLKVLLLVRLEGPLGGHDLADLLGVTAPTVSGLVDRLAERGLVTRLEDAGDRRVRRVRLSPAGTRLVEELLTAGQARRSALLHRLDPATLAGLVAGVAALAAAADGADPAPAPEGSDESDHPRQQQHSPQARQPAGHHDPRGEAADTTPRPSSPSRRRAPGGRPSP